MKKLLFVMNNLNCGGAEKSLISLLQTMDYSKYEVDLYLFKHEGMFLSQLPKQVRVLDEPLHYAYFDMPIWKAFKECLKKREFTLAFSRLCAGYIFYTEKNRARCEQRVWKFLVNSLPDIHKQYDVAIGFLEKNPVYFSIEKVRATRKLGFIHNDYDKLGMDPIIDNQYFEKLDYLVTVSKACGDVLEKRFPEHKHKVRVIHNIVSPAMIHKMSLEDAEIAQDKGTKIVSIGRLNYQKGFELAIETCRKLIDMGYDIKWYVIGEGEERVKLEQFIEQYNVQNHFFLLGLKENPYPYIREADIYVQPSRFEGKSIAIDEAMMLKKNIIVTDFSTAKDQIKHMLNGMIVARNAESLADGIKKVIKDDKLRNTFFEQLSNEDLGTESEIEKLYALL